MKKTIVLAAMLVGTLSAQAAFVASGDTYAIINIPIISGMNAVGISLLPMEAGADRIHDVVLPAGLKTTAQGTADQLSVWGGSTYNLGADNAWTNGLTSPQAVLGQAVWIKAAVATNIYEVGIVKTGATTDVACTPLGYTFVANPYPADLDVDGVGAHIDWSEVAAWNKNPLSGDLLRIWTGTQYDTYYYFNNGTSGIDGWYSTTGVKNRRPPIIAAGTGFFFQRKTTDIDPITVTSPF